MTSLKLCASNEMKEPDRKRVKSDWESDDDSDNMFTIVNGDNNYLVDKSLIIKHSQYFRQLIQGPTRMQESQANLIEVKGVDESAFAKTIKFMKGENVKITWDNVDSLLNAASHFLVDDLITHCGSFLSDKLSSDTLVDILDLCKTYTLEELIDSVELKIIDEFPAFATAPSFLEIELKMLSHIVSSDRLTVESELWLFQRLTEWIEKSPQAANENRSLNEGMLLSHVRYCLMCITDVKTVQSSVSYVQLPDSIKSLVDSALKYRERLHAGAALPVCPDQQNQMRVEGQSASLVLVFEGMNINQHEIVAVRGLTSRSPEVVSLHTDTADHKTCGVVTLDNCVYILSMEHIGGFDVHCQVKLSRFDPRTGRKHLLSYLSAQVITSGLAVVGRKIYFCGGISRSHTVYVNTVQSFDVDSLEWVETEPHLIYSLYQHGTTTFNDSIYISGGLQMTPGQSTNKLWSLKPGPGAEWQELAPLKFRRRCHTMLATDDGKLIVCGGMSTELPREYQKRIPLEIYDIRTNQWTEIRQNSALMGDSYGHYIILPQQPSSLLSLGHELHRAQEHEIWKTDIDDESDKYLIDEMALSLPPRMKLNRTFATYLHLNTSAITQMRKSRHQNELV